MTDPERRPLHCTVVFATLVGEPTSRCTCCNQVTDVSLGWDVTVVPKGTLVPAGSANSAGVAPCGATFGTAAGPNDGVTRCSCGEVHPLQASPWHPDMPVITVEQARRLRDLLINALGGTS